MLVVGCADIAIGSIVRGSYTVVGQHHGKPLYKKTKFTDNGEDVMCYFWDGHDEPTHRGWWFTPRIGSVEVWAFNPQPSNFPFRIGWQLGPLQGVDDTMVLSGQGIGRCNSQGCQENAADYCVNAMCKTHCAQVGNYCVRHQCAWQVAQNQTRRADRATRRRGGRQAHGPYNQ
jgi:hypothetical protein